MPALPASILEPLVQFVAALPTRQVHTRWAATAPASPDRLCSVLAAYDRLFGLQLEHLAVDGCITKAPCGDQTAAPARSTAASTA